VITAIGMPGTLVRIDSPAVAVDPDLSAIVLCYREGERIVAVLDRLWVELTSADVAFELVLVGNYHAGADDPTPAVLERWAQGREGVVVLAREKQGAMGWDMRTGLAAARGGVMIVTDGDDQTPPEDIMRMYRELRQRGAEVMKGRRTTRHDGFYRGAISVIYNGLFRLLFRPGRIWDINGKPKALTRRAYEAMELTSDDWFIDAEIVLQAKRLGFGVAELPVEFHVAERASWVRASAIAEFLRNMARARFRRS
jgi:glycosyltransferase involved in cell wall biosynthesis